MAFALLGLALLLGLYSLSRGQEVAEAPPAAPREEHSVWIFARDAVSGEALSAAMLEAQTRPGPAPAPQVQPGALMGRVLMEDVVAGTELDEGMLGHPQPLLDALAPGYRALALRVDEVSAVGGHLNSGDRVDVLYYLKANRESGQDSSARRLLANVQVLAHGHELIGDPGAEPTRNEKARSVVLAVPEQEMAGLLLAESTGSLRLAVIGRREERVGQPSAMPIRLKELAALERLAEPAPPVAARPLPPRGRAAGGPRVEVFYGEHKAVFTTAR
ncbi:Flp pilus assembly protein CpaB [Zobellella sp. An-6]|uniref:Flp pilus assembly protein CpaB n=1 Tax=Zobellella sp. An-6 TaxID=3400218 RepID=UPI004041C88E